MATYIPMPRTHGRAAAEPATRGKIRAPYSIDTRRAARSALNAGANAQTFLVASRWLEPAYADAKSVRHIRNQKPCSEVDNGYILNSSWSSKSKSCGPAQEAERKSWAKLL